MQFYLQTFIVALVCCRQCINGRKSELDGDFYAEKQHFYNPTWYHVFGGKMTKIEILNFEFLENFIEMGEILCVNCQDFTFLFLR